MGVPAEVYRTVERLVEQFDANLAAYKSGHFDEAQLRVDFLNPLLKDALG